MVSLTRRRHRLHDDGIARAIADAALSTSLQWLQAQDDCDPVRLQLVHGLQQNAAMKRCTKLTQRRVATFFLLTNAATRHARGYRSFDIIMNNQIFHE